MKLNPRQIEAVLALPGPERFDHFVKVVADSGQLWSLYQEGWALAATSDGTQVFPLWPAKEYAQLCAACEWDGYAPRSIDLDDFIEVILPELRLDKTLPGVFPTPTSKGVTPSIDELEAALKAELLKY